MRYMVRLLCTAGLTLTLSLTAMVPVMAQPDNGPASKRLENTKVKVDAAQQRAQQARQRVASKAVDLKLRRETTSSAAKGRLAAAKLRVCQNHQKNIMRHMENGTAFATRVMNTFGSIADKAEAFKEAKNIQPDNYQTLVADVDSKKMAVATAIDAANSRAGEFSCDSEGPKAQLGSFVTAMDDVRTALKEYRTSIKSLIQAIRQANGQNRQATSSAEVH